MPPPLPVALKNSDLIVELTRRAPHIERSRPPGTVRRTVLSGKAMYQITHPLHMDAMSRATFTALRAVMKPCRMGTTSIISSMATCIIRTAITATTTARSNWSNA
jgi:hypothetical protein